MATEQKTKRKAAHGDEDKRMDGVLWRMPCRKRQRRQRRRHDTCPRRSQSPPSATGAHSRDHQGNAAKRRACAPLVAHLPDELIERVLGLLSGRDLAAVACTCRAATRVADCERLWKAAYRRDICAAGPPIEHADHEAHGKSTRWLYGLMAAPVGRVRLGPTGRLTARLAGPDGTMARSGEFDAIVADPAVGVEFVLDGYGAESKGSSIREGYFVRGSLTGPGRLVVLHKTADRRVSMTFWGPFVDGMAHGLMRIQDDSGTVEAAEYTRNMPRGRFVRVLSDGSADAGSTAAGGLRNVRTSVERTPSGTLNENVISQGGSSMELIRRYNEASPRNDGPTMRCASHHKDGTRITHWTRRHTTPEPHVSCVCQSARGVARYTVADRVIVADASGLRFLAVGCMHADRRLAGRRWMTRAGAQHVEADDALCGLPETGASTETSIEARVCDFDKRVKGMTADTLVPLLERAGLTSTAQAPHPVGTVVDSCDDPGGTRDPFGIVAFDGKDNRIGDVDRGGDHTEAIPQVRCFLTGTWVPAGECALFASGRFYRADLLCDWLAFATCDPETGDAVPPNNPMPIAWRPWMQCAPPAVLAWAVRHMATSLALGDGPNGLRETAVADLLRATVVGALGTPMRSGLDVLTAAAMCQWKEQRQRADRDGSHDKDNKDEVENDSTTNGDGGDGGPTLTPGFDYISLAHLELRHPQWDPRGKWTFGPPAVPPADPTMGEHERDPDGPPDRFVQSHDILRVALDGPSSFVGARLRNVFFFGHAFRAASFAAAALDRCAFVGCTFDDDCTFARAVLADCGFHACRDARGRPIDVRSLRTAFHAVVS